jgi:predicted site-specific integrase-resolvase
MKAKQVAIVKGVTAQTVKIWIREGKLKANITPKGYDITEKQLKEFDKKWK